MSMTIPTHVRMAANDPKAASNSALLDVVSSYSELVSDEALELASEELGRRGGDLDFPNFSHSSWEL